jgi:hypothetical protein
VELDAKAQRRGLALLDVAPARVEHGAGRPVLEQQHGVGGGGQTFDSLPDFSSWR